MKQVMQKFEAAFKHTNVYVISDNTGIVGDVCFWTGAQCRVFINIAGAKRIGAIVNGSGFNRQFAAVETAFAENNRPSGDVDFDVITHAICKAPSGSDWTKTLKSIGYTVTKII